MPPSNVIGCLHDEASMKQMCWVRRMLHRSSPLKFFAVFSATVWDFNLKFYSFIKWNLHLIAKQNVILLKNDEVADFLTWPCRFLALKMFKLKMLFNFQKPVTTLLPMMSQWRFDKQWFIFFINYDLIIVLFKQSPAAHRAHLPAVQRAAHGTVCAPTVEISSQRTSGLKIRRI